jgi:uncharacterized protein DUF6599
MRPRFAILVVTAAFFLITPLLRAADVPWPPQLGSLKAKFDAEDLHSKRALTGVTKQEQEAGFVALSSQTYEGGNGAGSQMILYTYRDSSGAYQGYTFLRGQPAANPAADMIVRGNLVLWVSGYAAISPEDRKSIGTWLESASDHVASPPVADYLPTKGMEGRTQRYSLGPIAFRQALMELGRSDAASLTDAAGFSSHAEAMFGAYKNGKDSATLLLLEYPTPQLAELHLRHLQRALADAKLTTSSIERKGSLLSIVLAPTSPEYADKLRGSVNYETQVTWNEPSSTATDPPITSTLVKIIIATFVFMGVTLVLGIAFGGVRVITKRLFPGKVFDRKEQIEVLQLGLSGKPIDPTDLY